MAKAKKPPKVFVLSSSDCNGDALFDTTVHHTLVGAKKQAREHCRVFTEEYLGPDRGKLVLDKWCAGMADISVVYPEDATQYYGYFTITRASLLK